MASPKESPTTKGDEARSAQESKLNEEQRTTRELGKNSSGDPTLYPSDVESVRQQYNLTGTEAEGLLRGGKVTPAEADKLKAGRVVYQQAYRALVNPLTVPETLADARREAAQAADEETQKRGQEDQGPDPALPTSGPYGPNEEYTVVESPEDKDHVPVVVSAVPETHLLTDELGS